MSTMPIPQDLQDPAQAAAEEDAALARRAAVADVRAFEQLYRRHHRRIHGVIVRLVAVVVAVCAVVMAVAMIVVVSVGFRASQGVFRHRGNKVFGH